MSASGITIVELWNPIPGYEGRYEASNQGNVRSLGFWMGNPWGTKTWKPGRTLKPTAHPQGYRMVTLTDESGRRWTTKVPRLVLLAWVGPPPQGKTDVLHGDDIPDHDHIGNLRWGDQSENSFDSVKNGVHPMASRSRCPLGHLLVEPNLVMSAAARQCLACKRANSCHRNDARRMPTRAYRGADGFQRQLGETQEQEAHRRYAHIMQNYVGEL